MGTFIETENGLGCLLDEDNPSSTDCWSANKAISLFKSDVVEECESADIDSPVKSKRFLCLLAVNE